MRGSRWAAVAAVAGFGMFGFATVASATHLEPVTGSAAEVPCDATTWKATVTVHFPTTWGDDLTADLPAPFSPATIPAGGTATGTFDVPVAEVEFMLTGIVTFRTSDGLVMQAHPNGVAFNAAVDRPVLPTDCEAPATTVLEQTTTILVETTVAPIESTVAPTVEPATTIATSVAPPTTSTPQVEGEGVEVEGEVVVAGSCELGSDGDFHNTATGDPCLPSTGTASSLILLIASVFAFAGMAALLVRRRPSAS